jgi:AraC-like DNA-binding protein
MGRSLAVTRAAHLHIYLDVLRSIGAPVARDLARSRLPTWVEEMPDEYVSLPHALDWARKCGGDFELMELGFLASSHLVTETLRSPLQRQLALAQTGFAGVHALQRAVEIEDSVLSLSIGIEGNAVRVFVDIVLLDDHPSRCIVEWQTISGILLAAGVRSGFAGDPREITFVSRHSPPIAALEHWPDTRILTGQPYTSVLFDRDALARPLGSTMAHGAAEQLLHATSSTHDESWCGWTFSALLRALIRPYLRDGYPDLVTTAEIAGISCRTLQRRLQEEGRSYTDIVQEARFDLARDLLNDQALRIIDVSMMCSYENPQHFSRAFRKFAGISPRQYRQMVLSDTRDSVVATVHHAAAVSEPTPERTTGV